MRNECLSVNERVASLVLCLLGAFDHFGTCVCNLAEEKGWGKISGQQRIAGSFHLPGLIHVALQRAGWVPGRRLGLVKTVNVYHI